MGNLHHEIRRVLFRWPCNHVETPGPRISALTFCSCRMTTSRPVPESIFASPSLPIRVASRCRQVAVTSFFEPLYQSGSFGEVFTRVLVAALF